MSRDTASAAATDDGGDDNGDDDACVVTIRLLYRRVVDLQKQAPN